MHPRALRDLMRDALAAMPGSDLKLAGVVGSERFEAKLDGGRSGRARVRFSGLTFDSDAEVDAFLAPFAVPEVRRARRAVRRTRRYTHPRTVMRQPSFRSGSWARVRAREARA